MIVLLGNAEPSGLEDLLRTYNVELGKGLVVDPRLNYYSRPFLIFAPIPPGSVNQPIVDSLGGRYVMMPNSAPIEALGGPPKPGSPATQKGPNPGVTALPFLKSGPESWVESTPKVRPVVKDAGKDTPGPANLGVAGVHQAGDSSGEADPPDGRLLQRRSGRQPGGPAPAG